MNTGEIVCVVYGKDLMDVGRLVECSEDTIKISNFTGNIVELVLQVIKDIPSVEADLENAYHKYVDNISTDPELAKQIRRAINVISAMKTVLNLMQLYKNIQIENE